MSRGPANGAAGSEIDNGERHGDMSHYNEARWLDWSRGLVHDSGACEMSGHLARGCRRCQNLVATLRRLGELAAADRRQRPPDGAVRIAKALLAVHQAGRLPAGRRLMLERFEDGMPTSPAAGVRGAPAGRRQSYGGGGIELALLLPTAAGGGPPQIGGELVDRGRGHLAGVPAMLVRGGEVVDRATTDEVGCFRLTTDGAPARLCLLLEDERLLELELEEPAGPRAPAGRR